MERIDLATFLLIAEAHTGINAHQLARMSRVTTLAASALAAPFAGFGDFEAFPAFETKAAIYAARISNYQPLPDGNKRTAYDVMIEFVVRNGHEFIHPRSNPLETANAIIAVSNHTISEQEFVDWIAERIS